MVARPRSAALPAHRSRILNAPPYRESVIALHTNSRLYDQHLKEDAAVTCGVLKTCGATRSNRRRCRRLLHRWRDSRPIDRERNTTAMCIPEFRHPDKTEGRQPFRAGPTVAIALRCRQEERSPAPGCLVLPGNLWHKTFNLSEVGLCRFRWAGARLLKQDAQSNLVIRRTFEVPFPENSRGRRNPVIRNPYDSINFANIDNASSTSSSVLKKCGETRRPAFGRLSTNTCFSAKRSTIRGASVTPIMTEPHRFSLGKGVFNFQPCSCANSMMRLVLRLDPPTISDKPTVSMISNPGIAE